MGGAIVKIYIRHMMCFPEGCNFGGIVDNAANLGGSNPPKTYFANVKAFKAKLECGTMPNVMAALPNIGGAFCSTPQSLADARY